MFRIEAFVEDKKLGDVLVAMAGLVRGQPSVMPVPNVEAAPGPTGVKVIGDGSITQMLQAYLRKSHRMRINSKELGEWLKTIGRSPQSASYLARQAQDAKILKKANNVKGGANAGVYDVVNPTKSHKPKGA